MKVRGKRECRECGTRWSYGRTGEIACPACGSPRSVATDDPELQTDAAATLDLQPIRQDAAESSTDELATRAGQACREYVARRGFVSEGTVRPVDETYVGALELRYAAAIASSKRTLTEDEELYVLSLLRSVDAGERPPADELPASFAGARGLAVARTVRDYRRDIRKWTAERSADPAITDLAQRLDDHAVRVDHLDGEIDPETAERLLTACRTLGSAIRGDGGATLADVEADLETLSATL
ncbi:DUF7117 family protein [Halovivax limisalsi]|uniref:DUF7117 family protein n=1 Tax=Halovivax limisalsi TaxID=1453760 RepID=UPI001FFC9DE0|nr:TFIIB-type zinc ribbon-containing protein [Halovivax limisalsi]